ncbi:MAG: lactate utilization protein [Clostridia bacterium]|nr:lactate utilization protein [Clostridia bacterium]
MSSTSVTLQSVAEALRRNNMDVLCVGTAAEVVPTLRTLLKPGDTVAVGGSRTLEETNVLPLLRNGDYRFYDRYVPGLTPEQIREIFVASLGADVYLCSANAVTAQGEIYCVDGNANRIAALCYGPRTVVLVVGRNKLVEDIAAAQRRVKTIAAPKNTARLGCATPCATTGICVAADSPNAADGCSSPARICCSYLTLGKQRTAGRIKVILVDEPLGF